VYARYRLQAKIFAKRGNDSHLVKCYDTLAQALDIFRNHLASHNPSFAITRSQLDDTRLFRCTSSNPIFADKSSIVFAEATLTIWKIVSPRWYDAPLLAYDLSGRDIWFWLRNLACFFGDIELFSFYCFGADSDDTGFERILTELPELLATAAAQGQEALFKYIVDRNPSMQGIGLQFALWGACCSGNQPITNMILRACPEEDIKYLCSSSLCGRHGSRRLPPGYNTIAAQLVSKCGTCGFLKHHRMLKSQAELRASSVVSLLLAHVAGQAEYAWSHHRHPPSACFSALWSACVNGDIECVRLLIEHGFFAANVSKDRYHGFCFDCLAPAVQANSFAICQALCTLMDISTHQMDFNHLASVDGSVEAMTRRSEINPTELDTTKYSEEGRTIGEVALKRAITLLRVENVRFLLEKGIRLHGTDTLEIEWRRKRANEQKFHQVQEVLQSYGVPPITVEL